ncbi:acetylornithine deacetylase or succinyl-diaminopimelate desuccinylase [Vibrio nigripulchritudo ATCC 27043]|uniref:M20 family metallopeptidase n=1 Tax=Vibrio nigripulchritudo TaxID=28173 RepID=UPI00021C1FBA|nr:M20 family metallopeptidase [Vibrio nigripulchritudo]EGU55645.1 acetylornithine deacetylase or succinyl-diaminopimelate desuccinylase [Vibrio nigripulchritudo ATCC 27043]
MDAVSLTQRLINIQTLNPPGDEQECSRYLMSLLELEGFQVRTHCFGEGRVNLIAEMSGAEGGEPLGFTGHMDTVPLGNADWGKSPFGGEIEKGRLYGRGSSDMKSGIAAFISACIKNKAAIKEGKGVVLILTGGEETGCDGAKAMVVDNVDFPEVGALIVGEPTSNYPVIGHKGALWLKASFKGVTAHSAMPEQGHNAIYDASEAVFSLKHLSIGESHSLMGSTTLNIGTIQGGININSVPDHCDFHIDIRTVEGMNHSCVSQKIQQLIGGQGHLETVMDLPPMLSDASHPWINLCYQVCQVDSSKALKPAIMPYFTDAAILKPRLNNIPTVLLGPGSPEMAHQTDEYCYVENIVRAVDIYGELISSWQLNT